jgi:AcrR family transcriptional regulator
MATGPGASKRPYLRAEDRRQALLAAASALVDREGLATLTMVGVADEAGISRQLVYRHFNDLDALVVALLRARFAAMEESFQRDAATADGDAASFIEARVRATLAMPAEDHRLVRSVFGGVGGARPDLAPTLSLLRRRLIDRYSALVPTDAGPTHLKRARIWSAVYALFGLWELHDEGLLSADDAVRVFLDLTSPPSGR